MATIAFYSHIRDQAGTTVAALAYATYLGIIKNKRILFISTSFNNDEVKNAFWSPVENKKSGLFGPNTSVMSDNGIEGLDRVMRSNKITPDIITDYTKVVLKDRLELLMGYKGTPEQYKEIQKRYQQVANVASGFYDTVIIDVDSGLDEKLKYELINTSDVAICMTTQKKENIDYVVNLISTGVVVRKTNNIIVLGKYDDKSKYNAKNISRSILKQKNVINVIPYNTGIFEAIQEGMIIDQILKYLKLKGRDENTLFIGELQRLNEDIERKILEVQQMKN